MFIFMLTWSKIQSLTFFLEEGSMKAQVPRTHEGYNATYTKFHLYWILEIKRCVRHNSYAQRTLSLMNKTGTKQFITRLP